MNEINTIARAQINQIAEDCAMIKPKVVVWSLVYNHANYLKDYFEGILCQKTNFAFVVIVHDDASTDESANIIKEYAEKYPDIIKPIFEKENQYSETFYRLNKIMEECVRVSGAEYIALCEGDDFWTDSSKLQKQVNFLDHNPDYGFVHTNAAEIFWEDGFKRIFSRRRRIPEGKVFKNIVCKNFIYTATVLFRVKLLHYLKSETIDSCYFDRIMWICFSRHVKFHYIDELTSTYRVLKNSVSNGDYHKVLEFLISTSTTVRGYLIHNNISEQDRNLFEFERNRQILKYSYLSGEKEVMNNSWNVIKSLGSPRVSDVIVMFSGKFKISPKILFWIYSHIK